MIHQQLVAAVFLWALVSLGLAVLGLAGPTSERRRGFWLMTGLWGLVDGAIAWYALVSPPLAPAELRPILGLNAGLDVLYLAVGAALAWRTDPRLRGFGWAIIIQGMFLLGIDLFFYGRSGGM